MYQHIQKMSFSFYNCELLHSLSLQVKKTKRVVKLTKSKMYVKLFDLTYFDCTCYLQAQSGLPLESTTSCAESTGCCHPAHWHSKSHCWHMGRGKGIPSQGTASPLPVRYSAYD
jgi:hypothetical protein